MHAHLRRVLPALSQQVRHRPPGARKHKTVEVLLARDKAGLGKRGDSVHVAPGNARHRLVPYGDAVRTVLEHEVEQVRVRLKEEDAAEKVAFEATVRSLESASALEFSREMTGGGRAQTPVTASEIAALLAKDFGVQVEAARIAPQSVEASGEHAFVVHLGRSGVPAKVRVAVVASNPSPRVAAAKP